MFCFEAVNFMLKIIYPASENHGFFLTFHCGVRDRFTVQVPRFSEAS